MVKYDVLMWTQCQTTVGSFIARCKQLQSVHLSHVANNYSRFIYRILQTTTVGSYIVLCKQLHSVHLSHFTYNYSRFIHRTLQTTTVGSFIAFCKQLQSVHLSHFANNYSRFIYRKQEIVVIPSCNLSTIDDVSRNTVKLKDLYEPTSHEMRRYLQRHFKTVSVFPGRNIVLFSFLSYR